ncbi:MAG: hydrogen peroxide-inducible genes activator [Pseudomonadota bacterium]
MNPITFRQLRYFELLAREGHFGRAAEAASVSQPALSMQIKELEEGLGLKLFERTARRVRLTGFGETFAKRVEPILRSVEELGELARISRNQLIGRFRLGIIPTIAPYLLPKIMGRLAQELPGLDMHVRESQTSTLLDELMTGSLHVAVVALPVSEPSLEEVTLLKEEFVLVRPLHEAGQPVPQADRLGEMRLLLLEEGHCFRDQALSFCRVPSVRPREMLDGSSLSTLVQLVSAGMGITLIPEMALEIETRSARVTTARFEGNVPSRTIGMVWRKSNPLAQQFGEVADIVKRCAAEV